MDIIIFGKQGCVACETTKNKFTHYIDKYGFKDKVKLIFYIT